MEGGSKLTILKSQVYILPIPIVRYPDPAVKVHDSIQLDIATGKIQVRY